MPAGTRRLLLATIPSPARLVLDSMTGRAKLALARDSDGRPADVVRDAIAAAIDALVAENGGPAWDEAGFAALRRAVADKVVARSIQVLRAVAAVHAEAYAVRQALAAPAPPALKLSRDDTREQLATLVGADVATRVGVGRLPDLRRYLEAMTIRLDRLPRELARDLGEMNRVHDLEDGWHDALDALPADTPVPPALADVRWMLEELRVSLFANALGTAYPVSEKRIRQVLREARMGA